MASKALRKPAWDAREVIPQVTSVRGAPAVELTRDILEFAKMMAKGGATEYEIAQALDVTLHQIRAWAQRSDQFAEALKLAYDAATDRVERSLYMKAVGYEYEVEKVFKLKFKEGDGKEREELATKVVTVRVEPDSTSAIFWLKSRRKADWSGDRQPGDGPDNPLHIQVDAVRAMLAEARVMKRAKLIEHDPPADDDDIVGSRGDAK